MEEKVINVLKQVNEEIVNYQGKNMMLDGVIDSFEMIEIVASLEEEFDIEIDAKDVIMSNFLTKETIIELIKRYC